MTINPNGIESMKIKDIFEPMIDFKRVAASVMGKKYYLPVGSVRFLDKSFFFIVDMRLATSVVINRLNLGQTLCMTLGDG